jgi:hypothetical protein
MRFRCTCKRDCTAAPLCANCADPCGPLVTGWKCCCLIDAQDDIDWCLAAPIPSETRDLCRDRAERFEHSPGIAPGTGRAFSVHHHGEASTSDMDGWAEQFICAGESKVSCGI